jgi:hypothetical protein
MKYCALLFLCLCSTICTVTAQDFEYNFQATEVKFSGAGSISIRHDSLATIYSTAHWRNTGLREPAGWSSGSTMMATANFEFKCAKAPDSVTIRGLGNDTINLPAQTVKLNPATGVFTCTYPLVYASKKFPLGVVNYYAPFNIYWEISFDKGLNWYRADTTDHKVYVTKSNPMTETTNFKYFHTVLELSCKNAVGQTTDTGIISKCWSEFTDQVVLNHKGDSLHYYKNYITSNTVLPLLLKYRTAQCYTFAQLFAALIKVQGINKTNNYVFITPKAVASPCGGTINRFLVKNWKFLTKSDSSGCPSFPYKNVGTTLTTSGYTYTSADVIDQAGIDGSCNKNPSSFFNNHQITKFDGVYYDACYGVKFNALTDIKTAAFDGWGVQLSPGTWNFTNDMSKADLAETITTW